MKTRFLVLAIFAILCSRLGWSLDLAHFKDCIGSSGGSLGYGTSCQLDRNTDPTSNGIWPLGSGDTLHIGRSVDIIGTNLDATDVMLQRTSNLGGADMMDADSGLTITISYLTFDGNRQGTTVCYGNPARGEGTPGSMLI